MAELGVCADFSHGSGSGGMMKYNEVRSSSDSAVSKVIVVVVAEQWDPVKVAVILVVAVEQ